MHGHRSLPWALREATTGAKSQLTPWIERLRGYGAFGIGGRAISRLLSELQPEIPAAAPRAMIKKMRRASDKLSGYESTAAGCTETEPATLPGEISIHIRARIASLSGDTARKETLHERSRDMCGIEEDDIELRYRGEYC